MIFLRLLASWVNTKNRKMKKQQSNEPFWLEIWLATLAKGCLAGNEKRQR